MNPSTEVLSSLNDTFKLIAWILAGLVACALAAEWATGRELERRRASEADALQKAPAEARGEAEALRRKLAPRDIAPERRQQMLEILRSATGAVHVLYPADAEARIFALRLESILKEAGWEATTEGAISFGPVVDFTVKVHNFAKSPPRATVLRRALALGLGEDVGLREADKTLGDDDVQLSVSHRPAE